MTLSKTQKIFLLIVTLTPLVLFAYMMYAIFSFIMEMIQYSEVDPDPAQIIAAVFSFAFPIILSSLITLGLLIFYIVHVAGNKLIETTERILWILLFVFFGLITFVIYWVLRIWPVPATTPPVQTDPR